MLKLLKLKQQMRNTSNKESKHTTPSLEVKKADYIMTTSKIWADKLRELHSRKLVYAMPHGFDETLYKNEDKTFTITCNSDQSEEIKIIYAGRLYPEMQDLSIFFKALSNSFAW